MIVGVAGVGRIGAFHARTLHSLDAVDSVVVGDIDPLRADVAPQELVESGIDALVIAAPTPAHGELISLAAAARLPVFCEKPVALDLPTLDAVIATTDAA